MMSYVDDGFRGNEYKVKALDLLEKCRVMKPGKDRERIERKALNLFEKGERIISEYRKEYEAIRSLYV